MQPRFEIIFLLKIKRFNLQTWQMMANTPFKKSLFLRLIVSELFKIGNMNI